MRLQNSRFTLAEFATRSGVSEKQIRVNENYYTASSLRPIITSNARQRSVSASAVPIRSARARAEASPMARPRALNT